MPNLVPAAAEGLPEINRRRLLGGIVAASAASTVAGGSAAIAATLDAPAAATSPLQGLDLDAMPRGVLWRQAIEIAMDLSAILDRLSADGSLMMEVHAAKSGHGRVHFRAAIPSDARGMLAHYAICYRQTAQIIEPDVTEWSHVTWADDDVDTRFFLAGCRKAVRS